MNLERKKINVTMGDGCEVSDHCSLENVELGNNVQIADGVQLKNVIVGDNTKLARNVTFYSPEQDTPVSIGSNCWISYGVFGEATGGKIIIDDYAVIAHRSTLLTSSGPGKKNFVMDYIYPEQNGLVTVGKYCWVGAFCLFLPDSHLAEGVVLGAQSLVKEGDYKEWSVYGGTPAKFLKKIDPKLVEKAKKLQQ